MNMKRFVGLALAMCIALTSVVAYSAPKKQRGGKSKEVAYSDIKVGYNYHTKSLRSDNQVVDKIIPMVLLSNGSESKFYNTHTEWLDSLHSTPEGRALSKEMMRAAVKEYSSSQNPDAMSNVTYKTKMYVFKNRIDSLTTVYDVMGLGEYGCYSEPFSQLQWSIGDSTKTILGYECIMAVADFHGRYWTAWFTPEIPVSEGPWKLCGLPGLILEASESSAQHVFVADGIEQAKQPMYPIYNPKQYDRMNRIDMLRSMRRYRDSGNSMVRAAIGLDLGADAPAQAVYDFLETDYR